MTVTREVILDLLPIYLSGEASVDTQALVESFMKQDPELSKRLRNEWMERINAAAPSALPPELELKTFRRTKILLGRQKWLMGLAIFFTSIAASFQVDTQGYRLVSFRFLLQSSPVQWALCIGLAVAFWASYFAMRRHLRAAAF